MLALTEKSRSDAGPAALVGQEARPQAARAPLERPSLHSLPWRGEMDGGHASFRGSWPQFISE